MSNPSDPSKRIPKSLGTDTQLLGQYSLTDLLVAGMPGVVVILVTQVVLPKSLQVAGVPVTTLTIPVAALAIGVGALFVYLTPAYTTSIDWLEQFAAFHRSETDLGHEEARGYTQVERILPRRDAIVRTDGALVGAVHVDPPTMALATDQEWQTKSEAFQDFVNTTVDFPIQIYSTTQAFPADEYLQRYDDRLSDADVKDNAQLQDLIEHYVEWYERELAERQMTIRDHYVVVPVTPREVRFERDGLAAKLADLPLLGVLIRAATSPPVAEERAAMADELDERLRQVERGLRGIEDVEASRIDAEELTGVIGEFWAGQSLDHGDLSHRIRTTPLVTRSES
jgi:hypothetical protein